MKPMLRSRCWRENALALLICLMLVLLVILSADAAPAWIYAGF